MRGTMSVLFLRCSCVKFIRRFSSLPEYTEKPEYPPILDLSRDAVKRRNDEVWHNKIKRLEILEEKLMEVNMPRYYGWPCFGLYEGTVPYASLQFAQYITRTCVVTQQELPTLYQSSGIVDVCTPILEHVKNSIKEAVVLEHAVERNRNEINESEDDVNDLGDAIVHQINRVILSSISADFPHLQICQVDHFPRVESFWMVGGIDPSANLEKIRKSSGNGDLGKSVDVKFQYHGRPIAQLRHEHPLPPVANASAVGNSVNNIPIFQYDPRVVGINKMVRHVTNIPGFWPGDASGFPVMSFHSSKYLAKRSLSYDDSMDAPYVHAMLASFAWLQAVACYNGFSTFQDVTYPLVTQTVLTDGQYWSFYVYQMNTMLLHSNNATENQKCNFCWGTKKFKLFDKVEDGKVVGFNEEVLKILLYFYLNVPQALSGIDQKPYLGVNTKYISDIVDKDKRMWLEQHFKHMYSNRRRDRLPYELYHWEKIYKVDHKTRPQEPRRRPFELNQKPLERRYDDHSPQYIRKSVRTHRKEKFEKTYYP